jgi:hypothetical protein
LQAEIGLAILGVLESGVVDLEAGFLPSLHGLPCKHSSLPAKEAKPLETV